MAKVELLEAGAKYSCNDILLSQLENKSILITGASGIIGTNFLYSLKYIQKQLGTSLKVYAVTNSEVPDYLKLLEERNSFEFISGDLANESFVNNLPNVNLIIHAATYGQPRMFMKQPEKTIKLNTYVTSTLFEKMLSDQGKFLFISSSEVYSGLSDPPFNETQIGTSNPSHPRACYIEAKRCGETIVNVYRNKGYDAKSVRLSLAYGPGTRVGDKRVLNNFVEKALVENEIKLLDKGNAKRTYCYVTDAIHMMFQVLLQGEENVYNIAGFSAVTIAELAQQIGKICGVKVFFPEKDEEGISGAPEDVRLDMSRFLNEFGQRKFTDLENGLKSTIDWQRSIYLK